MRTASLLPIFTLLTSTALGCSAGKDEAAPPIELKSPLERDQNPVVSPEVQRAAVTHSTDLGLRLLRATAGRANAMTSPHSIMTALAMAEAGATDATRLEMRAAMQLGELSDEDLYSALNRLDLDLATQARKLVSRASVRPTAQGTPSFARSPGTLAVSNGVFQQQRLAVLPGYLDVLGRSFGAAVQQVDFEKAPTAATDSVNAWIETRTGGAISQFFSEPLDAATRLVLANTVSFDGGWAVPFVAYATRDASFAAPSGPVGVKAMGSFGPRLHAQVEGARIVEMPFRGEGQDLVVDIVLPDGDLEAYAAALDGATLGEALDACTDDGADVQLSLPRFRLAPDTAASYGRALVELGMPLAFDDERATFAAMTEGGKGIADQRLYLADVQQRIVFDLDEYGVEASSTSAVLVAEAGSAPPQKPIFVMTVDRPFLVVLRDAASGQILFLGQITDPSRP